MQCRNPSFCILICLITLYLTIWGNLGFAGTVCPGVEERSEENLEFSDTEKNLICGKDQPEKTELQAWSQVPPSQAAFHLRAILQSKGYLTPTIEVQEDRVIFERGPLVEVRAIEAAEKEPAVEISKKRLVIGEPLTPSLLTELEKWSASELRKKGYPCPKVEARAQAQTGIVMTETTPGSKKTFGPVTIQPIPDLNPEVLNRYYAFFPDQEFDQSLLDVTESRIIEEGLLEQTRFVVHCLDPRAPLYQLNVAGEPHLWTFSFYASSEILAEASLLWRKVRIGDSSSYLEASLSASGKEQQFQTFYRWFFKGPESSASLRPLFTFRFQDEDPFSLRTEQFQFFYLDRRDTRGGYGVSYELGPELQFFHVFDGPLKGSNVQSLSLQSAIQFRSHLHEIYHQNIYEGWNVRLAAGTQQENWVSDFTAQNFLLEAEFLRNLTAQSPPAWMGAWRFGLGSTLSPHPERLPPTYRQYLGGIENLRGFSRLELPASGQGSLSRLHNTFEIRSAYWSENIWPLTFIDMGWLGSDSLDLDDSTYWSPGAGVYWRSPIGPVKLTAANGRAEGNGSQSINQWQFYFSLGERF